MASINPKFINACIDLYPQVRDISKISELTELYHTYQTAAGRAFIYQDYANALRFLSIAVAGRARGVQLYRGGDRGHFEFFIKLSEEYRRLHAYMDRPRCEPYIVALNALLQQRA